MAASDDSRPSLLLPPPPGCCMSFNCADGVVGLRSFAASFLLEGDDTVVGLV